ncbi:MAG: hypothetical protein QOG09_305 [Solirubrobacterales bacterium]|nr:hypothetical protein [Solirubrobacterales bacterium]
MTRGERALGIGLGVAIGIGVVVAFVFLSSHNTVDAPSLRGSTSTPASPSTPQKPAHRKARPVAVVRVVAGAPPSSGPPKLSFKRGQHVRFEVRSDSIVGISIVGIPGQAKSVPAGHAVKFDFRARKRGLFAVIVDASHIAIARLQIRG